MEISSQFIRKIFNHPYFRVSFNEFWQSFEAQNVNQTKKQQLPQIDSVAEQISQLLENSIRTSFQQQFSHIYESNRQILEQIQQIKSQLKHSPTLKTQSSTAQRDTNPKLQTSIFFQSDSQYDMRQIRKQFNNNDDQIENRILVNSFQINDDEEQQQRTYLEQEIEERINASIEGSISRIELTLEEKFQTYSAKIEQRIQQLKKTIASVVEAMNQKEFWRNQSSNNSNSHLQYHAINAFTKKQSKSNQIQKYNTPRIQQDTVQQHENPNQLQVKNTYTSKENEQRLSNLNSNSNKTIESLNKSINLGRTKIKSLFGFKSSTGSKQKSQV